MSKATTLTPCVKWTPDCQGKQDYDGRLISISTRYWPAGGGFDFISATEPEKGFQRSTDPGILPSAQVSIVLNHGEPDKNGYGKFSTLATRTFEGETEAEVKVLVEEWVEKQFGTIVTLLMNHYSHLEANR